MDETVVGIPNVDKAYQIFRSIYYLPLHDLDPHAYFPIERNGLNRDIYAREHKKGRSSRAYGDLVDKMFQLFCCFKIKEMRLAAGLFRLGFKGFEFDSDIANKDESGADHSKATMYEESYTGRSKKDQFTPWFPALRYDVQDDVPKGDLVAAILSGMERKDAVEHGVKRKKEMALEKIVFRSTESIRLYQKVPVDPDFDTFMEMCSEDPTYDFVEIVYHHKRQRKMGLISTDEGLILFGMIYRPVIRRHMEKSDERFEEKLKAEAARRTKGRTAKNLRDKAERLARQMEDMEK